MSNKRNVMRRSHAEVVAGELDAIAVQIGERIVQCSSAASQLALLGRDDLALPMKAEITSLLYSRDLIDARIKAINGGAAV